MSKVCRVEELDSVFWAQSYMAPTLQLNGADSMRTWQELVVEKSSYRSYKEVKHKTWCQTDRGKQQVVVQESREVLTEREQGFGRTRRTKF